MVSHSSTGTGNGTPGKTRSPVSQVRRWWRGQDLNLRPSGYEGGVPRADPCRRVPFRPVFLRGSALGDAVSSRLVNARFWRTRRKPRRNSRCRGTVILRLDRTTTGCAGDVSGQGGSLACTDPLAVGPTAELVVEDQALDVIAAEPESRRDLGAAELASVRGHSNVEAAAVVGEEASGRVRRTRDARSPLEALSLVSPGEGANDRARTGGTPGATSHPAAHLPRGVVRCPPPDP